MGRRQNVAIGDDDLFVVGKSPGDFLEPILGDDTIIVSDGHEVSGQHR